MTELEVGVKKDNSVSSYMIIGFSLIQGRNRNDVRRDIRVLILVRVVENEEDGGMSTLKLLELL